MLTLRSITRATAGVAGIVLFTGAAATAGNEADRFEKVGGSAPGVDFAVEAPGSNPLTPAQPGTVAGGVSAPSQGGGVAGGEESPSFDYLAGMCRSTVGGDPNAGTVPVDCRNVPAQEEADAPVAGDDAPPDAAALAQRAAGQLKLITPDLKTSPAAPVKALVGLETWLWVPDGQWQDLRESAKAGDTEVTVTARPVQTRWDMGESSKACNNSGRAWRKGLGQSAETPCGYTYSRTSVREPNKKYEISAVLRYSISWTCEGECTEPGGNLGTLDSAPAGAALQVSERQSVVTLR